MAKFFAKIGPESTEYTDFACSCGAGPDHKVPWSKVRCEKSLVWAYKLLSGENYTCDATNFLSRVVYYLNGWFGAEVEDISVDQWAGIAFKRVSGHKSPFATYIQCDKLEHGLAFTLRAYVKRFGPSGPGYDYIEEEADDH